MENLLDYRHVVEERTRTIFYRCLKKALSEINLKNIGFVGIIGPTNKRDSHDIDILIFPSKDAKIGEAIIEITILYKKIEDILKKHHERLYLAIAPRKNMQEMIYYLSTLEEGGAGMIPIHSLFFPDYYWFKKLNPTNFERSIKLNLKTLYGDFSIIKILKKIPQENLEPYFVIMDFEMNSRIKTFPRHLIRSSAESLFSYLNSKYSIPIKEKKFHKASEIERELERILKYLDKKEYY